MVEQSGSSINVAPAKTITAPQGKERSSTNLWMIIIISIIAIVVLTRWFVNAVYSGDVTARQDLDVGDQLSVNLITPRTGSSDITIGATGTSTTLKGEVSMYEAQRIIQYFASSLWKQQYNSLVASDGTDPSSLSVSYDEFKDAFYSNTSPVELYPAFNDQYYKWFLNGTFPDGSSIYSETDNGYSLPTVTPITSLGTVGLVAGGSATLTSGSIVSDTEYTTLGVNPATSIKTSLENSGGVGAWKTVGYKTADGVDLYQFNVTGTTTITASNIVLRNLFFNFSATSGLSILFTGINVKIENCVFQIPRNEGDGSLYFNVTSSSGGVLVNKCVFRNTATNFQRVELLGVSQLPVSSNLIVSNNHYTLNYLSPSVTDGVGRMFFTIPSAGAGNIDGNIYIVNNVLEKVGFANGQAYSDGSPKGFFGWNINPTRNYAFRAFIDNNQFVDCPVFRDAGIVAIGGEIPASWISAGGSFYIKNTDLGTSSYKKIMVYARQVLSVSSYNTPIFYTIGL